MARLQCILSRMHCIYQATWRHTNIFMPYQKIQLTYMKVNKCTFVISIVYFCTNILNTDIRIIKTKLIALYSVHQTVLLPPFLTLTATLLGLPPSPQPLAYVQQFKLSELHSGAATGVGH